MVEQTKGYAQDNKEAAQERREPQRNDIHQAAAPDISTAAPAVGITQIDGKPATSVRFERGEHEGKVLYDVSFHMERKTVARIKELDAESLALTVGERNAKAIADAEQGKGTLKGEALWHEHGQSPAERARLQLAQGQDAAQPGTLQRQNEADSVRILDTRALDEAIAQVEAQEPIPRPAPSLQAAQVEMPKPATNQEESLEVNSIEPDIEQEKEKRSLDEEVRENLARMWTQKGKAAAETDQGNANTAKGRDGDNEVVNDDYFQAYTEKPKPVVPQEVEARYIRVGNKFHYEHKPDMEAFEDKGNKLETRSNGEKVAHDLVAIASARGWGDIKVKGTDEFRRNVWLEASLKGIEVKGYKPTEADLAVFEKRKREEPVNTLEAGKQLERKHARENEPRYDSALSVKPASLEVPVPHLGPKPVKAQDAENRLAGTLLEHGKAPYNFDKEEKPNYYVKLRDDAGKEKYVWGLDLERAITESKAEVGQRVELENKGRQAVTVDAPVRDESGKVVGHEKKGTHRNVWEVKAEAFRSQEPKESVKEHPDLINAHAMTKAAELLAAQQFAKEEDRRRFMETFKDTLTKRIEQGHTLPDVRIREQQQAKEQRRENTQELVR